MAKCMDKENLLGRMVEVTKVCLFCITHYPTRSSKREWSLTNRFSILENMKKQSCLGQPLAARPAKGALRDKSWKETIFKISLQRFNVSIYM